MGGLPEGTELVRVLSEVLGDGMARDVGAATASAVGAYLWVKVFDELAKREVFSRVRNNSKGFHHREGGLAHLNESTSGDDAQ